MSAEEGDMGIRRGGGGGGWSMGLNDPPSPKRGHLHHWIFFSF